MRHCSIAYIDKDTGSEVQVDGKGLLETTIDSTVHIGLGILSGISAGIELTKRVYDGSRLQRKVAHGLNQLALVGSYQKSPLGVATTLDTEISRQETEPLEHGVAEEEDWWIASTWNNVGPGCD